MAKDIAPELLEEIQRNFRGDYNTNVKIHWIKKSISVGTATYDEVNEYAVEVGRILSKTLSESISADMLPDGRMYYNIAERILKPTLGKNYELVTDVAGQVQETLNKAAGIGIKNVKPALNADRIDGLINKISAADDYNKVKWLTGEPIVNFSQSIVDDCVKTNAEFHAKSGLKPKIIRTNVGGCCEWCRALAGEYSYPDVPDDIYRRHENCRCTVVYTPKKGVYQDVWSKEIHLDTVEARKEKMQPEETINNRLRNIAGAKARELGYDPVPIDRAVEVMRKDADRWMAWLTDSEQKAISKYALNENAKGEPKLFEKINGYFEGEYFPKNINEEAKIFNISMDIKSGILKNELTEDIIVYRRDSNPFGLEGETKKFLSTSVTQRGVFVGSPNMAIIVPAGTEGAYIEKLSRLPKQREFLLNRGTTLHNVYTDRNFAIYEVLKNE